MSHYLPSIPHIARLPRRPPTPEFQNGRYVLFSRLRRYGIVSKIAPWMADRVAYPSTQTTLPETHPLVVANLNL